MEILGVWLPSIRDEVDPGISLHIDWLNKHGFRTISSCSGNIDSYPHKKLGYESLMPHIVFNIHSIRSDLVKALFESLEKLDLYLDTRFSRVLLCIFSNATKMTSQSKIFSENQSDLIANKYSFEEIIDKLDKLIALLSFHI